MGLCRTIPPVAGTTQVKDQDGGSTIRRLLCGWMALSVYRHAESSLHTAAAYPTRVTPCRNDPRWETEELRALTRSPIIILLLMININNNN